MLHYTTVSLLCPLPLKGDQRVITIGAESVTCLYLGGCIRVEQRCFGVYILLIEGAPGVGPAVLLVDACQVPGPWEELVHRALRYVAGCRREGKT